MLSVMYACLLHVCKSRQHYYLPTSENVVITNKQNSTAQFAEKVENHAVHPTAILQYDIEMHLLGISLEEI